eukprot:9242332-Pyramimonas_sp.AAC.1
MASLALLAPAWGRPLSPSMAGLERAVGLVRAPGISLGRDFGLERAVDFARAAGPQRIVGLLERAVGLP